MIKSIVGSAILLAVVVGIGFLVVRQKQRMLNTPPPPNLEMPVMVVMEKPIPILLRQSATSVGTVVAPQSIQLRTELSGLVTEVQIRPGQEVKKDQVLIQLDTSVENAQLLSANAAQKMADSVAERVRKATSVQASSELELDQAVAQSAQAQAEVMRLNALIRKKTLRAPFNARAGLFDVHVGQYLSEGSHITMLQGLDDFVHVDFMMPQQVADAVSVGDNVGIVVDLHRVSANIIAIDTQADRVTRNVMARAKLSNPPPRLQPNDSVRVEIEYGQTSNAFKISAAALRRAPTGAFVYVVQTDPEDPTKQRAYERVVTPGASVGQDIAILSGLDSESLIVADGSFKIHEKTWVVDVAKNGPAAAPKLTGVPSAEESADSSLKGSGP